MPTLRPDPTFYPSPGMAMQAPAERLAYVTMLNVDKNGKHDALSATCAPSGSSCWVRCYSARRSRQRSCVIP
jgi:methanethiol oxidase